MTWEPGQAEPGPPFARCEALPSSWGPWAWRVTPRLGASRVGSL